METELVREYIGGRWLSKGMACALLLLGTPWLAMAASAQGAKVLEVPLLTSITREDPSPTNEDVVRFKVTFSTSVQGVLLSDFSLTAEGLTGAELVSLSGSGSEYIVSASTGQGDGTLRLDLNADNGITSLLGVPLGNVTELLGPYTDGEVYLIDKTAPLLAIVSAFGTGPGEDFTTGLREFELEGTTSGDTVQILLNGQPIGYTPGNTAWSVPLDLAALGPVIPVAVEALDAAGNASELASLTIQYDPLHDADGNGLPDQLEHKLSAILPADPLNPDLPPRDWFVSAADGDDLAGALSGGGSDSAPWRSVERALGVLQHLARESFPVRILLDDTPNHTDPEYGPIALYEGPVDLAPFVTLEPLNDVENTAVHLEVTGEGALIDGAEGAVVRNLVLKAAALADGALGALLSIIGESMLVEDVVFDGLSLPGSLGVYISGVNSSGTIIRRCEFRNLGIAVYALDTGMSLADTTFDTITANGADSVALSIDLSEPLGGPTPNLGSVGNIEVSGFNRFRNLDGAPAIALLETPGEPFTAQYNDWGVYTGAEIAALIEGPVAGQKESSGSVEYEPYIPEDKAIVPGGITGVVLREADRKAVALEAAPGALLSDSKHAMCDEDGLYFFDVLPGGGYTLFARAEGYEDSAMQTVRVRDGRITEAQRTLLTLDDAHSGSGPEIHPDVNGTGEVNATDVQLVINAALGLPVPDGVNPDVNRDGVVNAIDVQIVINAALGI